MTLADTCEACGMNIPADLIKTPEGFNPSIFTAHHALNAALTAENAKLRALLERITELDFSVGTLMAESRVLLDEKEGKP